MEIFDIVDENGNPTGQTIERKEAHKKGICHRTAHIWITRMKEGRRQVLLQKRAMNKDSFPGRYDTSSAGHITAGAGPLESALRELEEELGIYAMPSDLEFAGTFRIQYQSEFHNALFRDNEIAFVYVYQKPVEIEKLVLQKEELDGVEWFDLEETVEQCKLHNQKFCVPLEGLMTAKRFLEAEK